MSSTDFTDEAIHVKKERELRLRAPSQPGRPAFISAASGLAATRARLYVIADDELSLGIFSRDADALGSLQRLLPGELPIGPKPRKKSKPDFETVLALPAFGSYPHGALFALGSGSTERRCRGALVPFDAAGELTSDVHIVELARFFQALSKEVGRVNVEGAAICKDRFLVLQRGNKGDGINAVVTFGADEFLEYLKRSHEDRALEPHSVRRYDLGTSRDVPFGFTDAAPLANGSIVFSAVAEDTNDPVADGVCTGAALGTIGADGTLLRFHCVREPAKIEGLHAHERGDQIELLLVTDADDATVPASLLSAKLP